MKKEYGLITGGSSGFGRDFAYELAKRGYNLIIVGRREGLLYNIKKVIEEKYKVCVVVKIVELSREDELEMFIDEIKNNYEVEFLINNAGFGEEESFLDDSLENNMKMINVHINATLKLTYEFGKLMKVRGRGYIINVSSMASFLNTSSATMYCSTKAFIRSFSETLALELKPYNVQVQALCPGFARTDFHSKLNMRDEELKNRGLIRWMKSEEVVKCSLKNIFNKGKVVVVPGTLNRFLLGSIKLIPRGLYYKIMIKAGEWK
ncbi:MAG: SDR family NAD(P)-dependent oxidoreductase [Clostridium sp.]